MRFEPPLWGLGATISYLLTPLGTKEMSEWISGVSPMTKPVIYFRQGFSRPSGKLESGCQKMHRGKAWRPADI